ncbi:hypothetical protein AC1031_004065 [Aphanomyces cochlioides]|nr:hypothetical protein AC1031_004065 [Aphanomyces cochlioides]
MLDNVWAVADGLKLYLEQSGDAVIQNMFYNGWTHDHYVSNVFVFCPNGVIAACVLNAPGSMHDSLIAECGGLYLKIKKVYDEYNLRVVVDSAFCGSKFDFLIKSGQDLPATSDRRAVAQGRQATSLRQTAEWGMRALKGSFPRLKDRLVYEERGERRLILNMMVLLFNFRTRLVGINQIQSTYMPYLSKEANTFINLD